MDRGIIKQHLKEIGCEVKKEIQESEYRITAQIEGRIIELKARCDALEQKNLVQERSIVEPQTANQHIRQETKKRNVCIGSITESKEENVPILISQFMSPLSSCGITIDLADIDTAYRCGKAQKDQNIKIKFTKEHTANTIVRGSRELANKRLRMMEDLYQEGLDCRFLIRECIRNARVAGKTVTRNGNLAVIEGMEFQAVNETTLQIIRSEAW
ncbi:unnamed protein product [Allacma fusca]|uniref:Uncharacterized protein n=1 Tax=Allacma fusca TaxID=39272 RepID=A0A8J2NLZ8_9HEXA|nr:unnamed protein product [Allacma fusca]